MPPRLSTAYYNFTNNPLIWLYVLHYKHILTSFLFSYCSGQIGLRAEFNHLAEEYSLKHYRLHTAQSKFTLCKYSFNTGMNFADPFNIPGILLFAKTLSKEHMHTYKPQME